jgi:molybdate transport system substrate-binding protein
MTSPSYANLRISTPPGGARFIRALICGAVMFLGTMSTGPGAIAQAPVVAAASDLKFALDEVASRFAAERHERVELVFGSSGLLARQIQDGAPFELFLSADEDFVNQLSDAGLARDRGVLYGLGRIVLFAPRGSPLAVDPELRGLRALLARGAVTKFTIANPIHAPYGRAAEAVLRKRALWEPLQPSLVLGDNVAQAAQFATTGNAVGGILAYSLVLAPPLRDQGRYALISDSDHPPLRQRMVLLKRASPTAEHFYQYLQTPAARAILRRFGFSLPRG